MSGTEQPTNPFQGVDPDALVEMQRIGLEADRLDLEQHEQQQRWQTVRVFIVAAATVLFGYLVVPAFADTDTSFAFVGPEGAAITLTFGFSLTMTRAWWSAKGHNAELQGEILELQAELHQATVVNHADGELTVPKSKKKQGKKKQGKKKQGKKKQEKKKR